MSGPLANRSPPVTEIGISGVKLDFKGGFPNEIVGFSGGQMELFSLSFGRVAQRCHPILILPKSVSIRNLALLIDQVWEKHIFEGSSGVCDLVFGSCRLPHHLRSRSTLPWLTKAAHPRSLGGKSSMFFFVETGGSIGGLNYLLCHGRVL